MLTFSLASLCVQNSSGNNGPAEEGQAQQARNKWDHLKNQLKVAEGLNKDVETKLYLFYPCKLIHNLLKIADVIDCHCLRIANIQGQERVSRRVSRRSSAATGSWFVLMDEVLGQRPSTEPLS